jgi:long-chain acyl-CoA synthetase
MNCTNFGEFFEHVTAIYGSRKAIFWKENEHYKSLTGKKLKELVYLTAREIEKFNLKPGDKAAIISENRFEWVVTDFACIANRTVTVPIYTSLTASQIKFILEHSEVKLCFVSSERIAEKVSSVFDELPKLKQIICFNKISNSEDYIINFEDLIYNSLIHTKESYSEKEADRYFSDCSKNISENDLLTIIYTSGTTGTPKGVCLTHKNIITNIKQAQRAFTLDHTDRFLSFLPLAHSYERTTGYYFAVSVGAEVYYAQSIDTLQTQLPEVKPTLMTVVPLLFTKIYNRLMKNIQSMPLRKQMLVKAAFSVAKRYRNNKNSIVWKAADRLVFKTIRERTGGRANFFISGGSALNKKMAEFFDGIGITIYQGYGMTEASPVISVNRIGRNKFGTVGLPLDGVEVKIADDGEILVKSDIVMTGYYRNEEETKNTIIDGWLHTGDIGEMDNEGFIKITDRKKTLIKTAGGKYISLTHIEDTIGESDYVYQIISFASDDKHFVSALIVPDFEELKNFAEASRISYDRDEELIQNPAILKLFEAEINRCQKNMAKYERVRKFALLAEGFTIENDTLTPSLKLKRRVIEKKHRVIINKLYEQSRI